MKRPRSFRRCEAGAAAIEFAIVSLVMILVCIGVVELGRGLYMRNQLSYAADVAARQLLMDAEASSEAIETRIRSSFRSSAPERLTVTVGTEEIDEMQFRTVGVTYRLSLLIPGLATTPVMLSLNRRIPLI